MSIKMDLKKEKIEIIEQIDTLTVNKIAKSIANRIVDTFPGFYLDKNDIFAKLSKLNMYRANMPDGIAEACYFYKNTSIYFNSNISNDDLEEFAIHECIHYLQEKKNKRHKLVRMGISYNTASKFKGIGINEAAVQYMATKIIKIEPSFEKYYGITIHTPSPSYYPLECSLLNQINYFINEDILFRSTFFANDFFKNAVITHTSKAIYSQIETLFDTILDLEEKIINTNNIISSLNDGDLKVSKLQQKIEKYKEDIVYNYFQTQNIIIKNFFDYEFNRVDTVDKLELFRNKLYKFTNIMGGMKDYKFFDNYYVEMMNKIDHRYNVIENGGIETALATKPTNYFISLIEKIKKIFIKDSAVKKEI